MLEQTSRQVDGDADVERAVAAGGEDVDEGAHGDNAITGCISAQYLFNVPSLQCALYCPSFLPPASPAPAVWRTSLTPSSAPAISSPPPLPSSWTACREAAGEIQDPATKSRGTRVLMRGQRPTSAHRFIPLVADKVRAPPASLSWVLDHAMRLWRTLSRMTGGEVCAELRRFP